MNAIFEALSRASVFGLAALLVALIAQFALSQRVPAAWRAWIWRIALLQSAFALLPLSPVRWEILALPATATPTTITAPINKSDDPVADNLNLQPFGLPDAAPIESSPPVPNAAPIESAPPVPIANAQSTPLDWRTLLLSIYALGIAFQCAQLMRGKRQLQRVLRNCAPNEDANLTARLKTLAACLNLKTAPQLLISKSGSPFLTGIWRPQIVLPRALRAAEPSQIDAILAHELAHQKRRDLMWLGATWLLQTLLWFHPLSWVSCRFHGLETECACDELALQLAPIAPQSYGALLLNSMNNSKFSSPLAAGTCDTLFALKTRLLRLNNAPKSPRKAAKLAFALALLISCGAFVPLKLVARAGDSPAVAPTDKMQAPPSDSAVVQGVVTSEQTQKPLAGVTVILISDKITQQFVTDARGYFRFNVPKGNYFLGANQISPARAFYMENGQKRDFKLQLDETFKSTGKAVVQGVVLAPQSRKPLAGTLVVSVSGKELQQSLTDARGSFRFNVQSGKQMVSITKMETNSGGRFQANTLFDVKDGKTRNVNFDWDEMLKATDTNAPKPKVRGSAVVQGVITSKQTGKPLAGVNVTLTTLRPGSKTSGRLNLDSSTKQQVLTDNRGYFRFNAASGNHMLAVGFMATTASRFPRFDMQLFIVIDLKSAKKYDLGFDIDDKSKRDPNRIPTKLPATRGTGDAVVQGVVLSKQTRKPLAGVPIVVMAGNARMTPKQGALAKTSASQETVTDARGYFRFNVAAGVHSLFIDSKIWDAPGKTTFVDPRRMTVLVAKQVHVVTLGKTEMRNLRFELNKVAFKAPDRATTGTVVGPNGEPVANAIVQASTMSKSRGGSLLSVICDENGRFQLSAEMSKATVQLWADAGELTTPRSTFVGAGGHVKLQMEKNAWLSASGRVTDDKRQPLQGAKVRAHFLLGNLTSTERTVESDANGHFVFDRVRPGSKFFLTSTLAGYGAANYSANKNEKFADFAMTMPSANTSLRGVVTNEKGQLAKSFTLFVRSERYSTDANGQFFLPHVVEGKNEISVVAPNRNVMWKPIEVRGGDQNVKIRLTTATRELGYGVAKEYKPSLVQQKLIGKMAPPIQASYWANNKATPLSSVRGKVVLLVFNGFDYNPNRAIADFARSFAGRVQVIGVLPDLKSRSQTRAQIDATAKQYSFPIALDSPPQNQLGRPTLAAYHSASYAVIGRDGKIIYAGDELRSALQIASR